MNNTPHIKEVFPPYPEYRETRVDWLGDIPSSWRLNKLKFLAEIKTGEKNTEDKEEKGKYPFFVRSQTPEKISSYSYDGEAILTAGDGVGVAKVFHYIDGKFDYHQRVYKISDFRDADGKFIFYYLKANLFKEVLKVNAKSTVDSLRLPMFQNFKIALPPLSEQRQIARFLDYKTGQIDAAIDKGRRLIELLREERAALINEAVTAGVDAQGRPRTKPTQLPAEGWKESGVEWLGAVPEEWEVVKLKYLIKTFESGVSVNAIDTPCKDGEKGVLKTSCVYDYSFRPRENKTIASEAELQRAKVSPRKGEIIISRMNTPELVGASGYVDKDYPNLFLPDRLWQTKFHESVQINSKWLSSLFISKEFKGLLSVMAIGTSSSMKNISQDNFLNIAIPLPPLSEQHRIVHYIEAETQRIDQEISIMEREIELLAEYRQALISEAVTGKIDVRGVTVDG